MTTMTSTTTHSPPNNNPPVFVRALEIIGFLCAAVRVGGAFLEGGITSCEKGGQYVNKNKNSGCLVGMERGEKKEREDSQREDLQDEFRSPTFAGRVWADLTELGANFWECDCSCFLLWF